MCATMLDFHSVRMRVELESSETHWTQVKLMQGSRRVVGVHSGVEYVRKGTVLEFLSRVLLRQHLFVIDRIVLIPGLLAARRGLDERQ